MIAVFLVLALLFQAAATTTTGSFIQGVVLRTGSTTPVSGARVVLKRDGQSGRSEFDYGTFTSSDGHFEFKDVTPGRYRLSATQNGYVVSEYGQKRPNRPGAILDLSAATSLKDIVIHMTPGSVISGRVYDDAGNPLDSVQIQLIQPRYQGDGKIVPLMVSTTMTNDLGEYRLFWIAPGTYYVVATHFSRSPQPENALHEQFEGTESMFVPTFYPNAFDETRSTPVKVEAGTELRGIDLTMMRLRAFRVRGQVIDGGTGQPVAGTRVSIQPKQEGWANLASVASGLSAAGGEFDIRHVPQGTNTVTAMMTFPGPREVHSYFELQVSDRDISELRVVLQPWPGVSGKVTFEDPRSRSTLALGFSDVTSFATYSTGVSQDGSFSLPWIPAGVFRVVLGIQDSLFVRSAFSGSRNVLRDGLDTRSGTPEPLEVRLASSTGTVQGVVADEKTAPATGVQVVLAPTTDRTSHPELFKNVVTDQFGRFAIRGVVPGDYKLFAWGDIEPGIYHDPNFLEPYEAIGVAVHVADNGTVTANLKVIP